jgi:hypothetical protein
MANKNTKDIVALMETYSTAVGKQIVELEDEHGKIDSLLTTDTGPEGADGFEHNTPELTKEDDVDIKNTKKPEKLAKEDINTSITAMNDKNDNIFDKLYNTLMESDDLPSMDEDPFGGDEVETGDDLGLDDGGDKISIELDKDVAEKLHQALGDLLDVGDDSELEDLDGEADSDPFGGNDGDNPFEDSIEVVADPKPLADSNLKSGNNSNKQNKVKAAGYSGKGGKASSGKIPDVVADPKDLPETNLKSGNNSNMGSNKVQSPGTNQGELIK